MQCCAYTGGRTFFIGTGAVPEMEEIFPPKSGRGDEVFENLAVAHGRAGLPQAGRAGDGEQEKVSLP